MKRVVIVLMLGSILMSGCGGSKPARFYTLTPRPQPVQLIERPVEEDPVVALGPISFPDFLLRPQIATYVRGNQLDYADYDRWAEPLIDNFTRVMGENLSGAIPTRFVLPYPQPGSIQFDYKITVAVSEFALDTSGTILLTARWNIATGGDQSSLDRDLTTVSAPVAFEKPDKIDYNKLVQTMSDLVNELSRIIADRFKHVSP